MIKKRQKSADLRQHKKQNAISSPTDSNHRYIAISLLQISEDPLTRKDDHISRAFPTVVVPYLDFAFYVCGVCDKTQLFTGIYL